MKRLSFKKVAIVVLAMLLVVLPLASCAAPPAPSPPPPPPPPAPEAGFVAVIPPKIDYATLEKMWPAVAKALGVPEALVPKLNPALALLGLPVKFIGKGWQPGEIVTIDLIVPPTEEVTGAKPGEPLGIAVATADGAGNFEVAMEATAKINWLLRGAWTPVLKPDVTKVNPLPNGVYILKATGIDPRTVDRTVIELELLPPPAK